LLTNFEVWRVLNEPSLQKYDYDAIAVEIQQTISTMRKTERFRSIPYAELSQRDRKDVRKAHMAKDTMPRLRQLEQACWVRKQVLSYLSHSPTVNQTQEAIQAFLQRLHEFVGDTRNLSVVEVSQIIDLRPTTAVEMYRIIDDCEVRFNETQLEELISIVQECLPPRPMQHNANDVVEEVEGELELDEEQEPLVENALLETEIVAEPTKIVDDEAEAEDNS